jgi:hypothetical protein
MSDERGKRRGNMAKQVIDASVAVKWLIDGESFYNAVKSDLSFVRHLPDYI